jgi:hypothetical protein
MQNNQTPARARAVAGDTGQDRGYTDRALAAVDDIAEDGDCDLALAGLETTPGQQQFWVAALCPAQRTPCARCPALPAAAVVDSPGYPEPKPAVPGR